MGVELTVSGIGAQTLTVCRTEVDASVLLGYSQSSFFEPGSLTKPESHKLGQASWPVLLGAAHF